MAQTTVRLLIRRAALPRLQGHQLSADTRRVECPPVRAQAWLDGHTQEFDGLELDDAVALIESAGLHARVIHYPGGWMTQELRHDRVNVWLTQDGSIASLDVG